MAVSQNDDDRAKRWAATVRLWDTPGKQVHLPKISARTRQFCIENNAQSTAQFEVPLACGSPDFTVNYRRCSMSRNQACFIDVFQRPKLAVRLGETPVRKGFALGLDHALPFVKQSCQQLR